MDKEQQKLVEDLLFSEVKKKSFAKSLFFGEFFKNDVIPYPAQPDSDEKNQFFNKLAAFIKSGIDPVTIDKNAEIPESVIKGLGDLGVLGMTIPKEYGGSGYTQKDYCKAAEMIAGQCGATALFVNAHQSIGLKALLLFGTEKQKARWLPPLAKGELLAAFSLTEPNAGSDANGIETRAEYNPDKKAYVINGRKQWTTNGAIAGVLTVMAKTTVQTKDGPQDKVTAFLVTPDMPGFKVLNPALDKVGMRGSKTANLAFENLEVPEENILGPLGGGLKVCLTVLDYGRTTFGATCTGAAKVLLRKAIDHAKTRYQFKRPLASFPLVKKKIALMAALTYAMEATTYMTAGFVDKKVEDFMLESAMLKVFTSDSLWTIVYETMQILGGRSFFTDAPYERMMRDARLNMIGEGSNEVMRAFIGLVGMRDVGTHLKEGLENMRGFNLEKIWGFAKDLTAHLKAPSIKLESDLIAKEAEALSQAIKQFGQKVVQLLGRYREEIVEKQLAIEKIANAAIALYTVTAVLSRLDSALQKKSADKREIASAKLYCKMAFQTIDQHLKALDDNFDAEIEETSDLFTEVGAVCQASEN